MPVGAVIAAQNQTRRSLSFWPLIRKMVGMGGGQQKPKFCLLVYNDTIAIMINDLLSGLRKGGEEAVHRQLAKLLAAAIRRGELSAGDRLPPVRQVAAEVGVNFNTIARGYRLLADQGLVETRRGRGTIVVEGQEAADPALVLEAITAAYLQRVYLRGFGPQEVRLELMASIRRWLQEGAPPMP